ncbi:MAG: hypothetical protein WCF30_00090 [Terracidiphilus sp.]
MHLTGIDLLFWAAGFVANVVLLLVLWVRHRAATFPFFTLLIANSVLKSVVLYFVVLMGGKHAYLIAYLSFASLDLILQLCVVYEMASHVFRPLGYWVPDARVRLALIVLASIAIGAGLTWLSAIPPDHTLLRTILIRGDFFSAVLMTELFAGMVALSATIRLPWRTHAARIAQGLGFYSFVCILIEAGHSYLGIDRDIRISADLTYFRMLTYLICAGYWIVMLWLDAPVPRALPKEMEQHLLALQRQVEAYLQRLRTLRG